MGTRLLMQVNEGREAPIDVRTNKPCPRGPRWYPHINYWLRRWKDGTMSILDSGSVSQAVLDEAFEGPKVDKAPKTDDTAAKPSQDTVVRPAKKARKGRK